MDEMGLLLAKQWNVRDYNAHIFAETHLYHNIQDSVMALVGWTVPGADRAQDSSRGGANSVFYICLVLKWV